MRSAALFLSVVLAACSDSTQTVTAERLVVGDTTILRVGAPLWGDSIALVEELSVGVVSGPTEYQFGAIAHIAVDRAEGTYVFDAQVPALRYFDAEGNYVRTLGREGQGPGEYGRATLGLVVRTDNSVVLRDFQNSRLNFYSPAGQPESEAALRISPYVGSTMTADAAGHFYLTMLPQSAGLLHLDPQGEIVDSLAPPSLPDEPVEGRRGHFDPRKVWVFDLAGGFWVGLSDSYSIQHIRPDGTVLQIERDISPAEVAPEERDQYEAFYEWWRQAQGTPAPAVPNVKPFYRSFEIGSEGRLWVERFVEATEERVPRDPPQRGPSPPDITWSQPTVYDVFESNGEFLGSVHVPDEVELSVFRGDQVWGVRYDSLDVPYVVRFGLLKGN